MDYQMLVLIVVAVGAGSVAKGATGMGMPLIAIPMLASITGLQHAICVLIVPILVSNAWQIWDFRKARADQRLGFLSPMLIACCIGVGIGTWVLTTVPERGLALTLGLLLLGYLGLRLAKPNLILGPDLARRWALPAGLGAGVLHGSTGISAPIGVTFIHAMRLGRQAHVYATSVMFLLLGVTQALSLWLAGVLRPEWLVQSAFALLPTFLFMPVGQWLASKLSSKAFDRMILVFLGIIGVKSALGL